MNKHPDCKLIDALGGTTAVSLICRVKPPSVSQWRRSGIPEARRMYLEAVYPEVVADVTRRPEANEA